MKTVNEVIETLGREELMARFNVGSSQISNIKSVGLLPASWFEAVRLMAKDQRVNLPSKDLFAWKGLDK